MSSGHVLVVNTGKPEYVGEVQRRFGLPTVVLTEEKYATLYPARQPVVTTATIDDVHAVAKAAHGVHRRTPVVRVVAPTERSVLPGAVVRRELGLPGLDVDTAGLFTDKHVMKRALQAARIPIAPFAALSDESAARALLHSAPTGCILKPARGSGSIGTVRLRKHDDLPPARSQDAWILERHVDMNAELHSEGVTDDGVLVLSDSYRYWEPVLGTEGKLSGSFPVDEALAPVVHELHQRVVTALGLRRGTTHLQLFATTEGLVVNEITCRPPGGGICEQVALGSGIDLVQEFLAAELLVPRVPTGAGTRTKSTTARLKLPVPTDLVTGVHGFDELIAREGIQGVLHTGIGGRPPGVLHSGAAGGLLFADTKTWDTERLFELVARTFRFCGPSSPEREHL